MPANCEASEYRMICALGRKTRRLAGTRSEAQALQRQGVSKDTTENAPPTRVPPK
jgi:hypothetical protein